VRHRTTTCLSSCLILTRKEFEIYTARKTELKYKVTIGGLFNIVFLRDRSDRLRTLSIIHLITLWSTAEVRPGLSC
jgi:hypothetical protein